MKVAITILLTTLFSFGVGFAAQQREVNTPTERFSYSLGYQIGKDLKRQDLSVDLETMRNGTLDGLAAAEPKYDQQQMQQLLVALKKQVVAAQSTNQQQAVEQTMTEDRAFLEANSRKEGVISLPSGLQYQVLKSGKGRTPTQNDKVTINYRGPLTPGQDLDLSQQKSTTATPPVRKMIPGMQEAVLLMREGDSWRIFVPAALSYDENGPLQRRAVIFDLELIAIKAEK